MDKSGQPREYVSHLLRRTYRQDGKVKHETLANLSALPEATRGEPGFEGNLPRSGPTHGQPGAVTLDGVAELRADQTLAHQGLERGRVPGVPEVAV